LVDDLMCKIRDNPLIGTIACQDVLGPIVRH